MANNVSASFETIWAREQQEVFYKRTVSSVVADVSKRSLMSAGQTLTRTYRSGSVNDAPSVYSRGTDITLTDITDTAETLVVNKQFADGFYVDDFDAIQDKYDIAANYGKDYGERMKSQIDADVLYEVVNASSVVDAGSVGGTAGQGITLATATILNVFTAATKKLAKLNIMDTDKVGVISPEVEEFISLYYGAKVTDLGDKVAENGYFTKISGYQLYTSNNVTGSAVLAMATNPTANDTVTIQGVTFTFVSSIGTTAGNVLIGANVDATRANLAALINAPWTTTANGVALTGTNLKNIQARAVAVNDNTADTLTVRYKGAGVLTVSETLTAGADVWTTALQKQLCLLGVRNMCTTLVVQSAPKIYRKEEPKKIGGNYLSAMLYGIKTFADNAKNMVRVEIASSGF